MLVKHWMSRPVITVAADDTVLKALNRMEAKNVRTLPVIEAGRVVGLLSEAELHRTSASGDDLPWPGALPESIASEPVAHFMTPKPQTVTPDVTMEEAAQLMLESRIKALPVVDSEGAPVGIITRTDILKVLINLTGVARKGIQYALKVADRPRSIQEITDTIRSYGGRMISILTSSKGVPAGYRKAYIRVYGIDRFKLYDLKDALSNKAELIYVQEKLEIRRESVD